MIVLIELFSLELYFFNKTLINLGSKISIFAKKEHRSEMTFINNKGGLHS